MDLLRGPEIDAVAICTPPQDHVDLALAALDHGKHVLIEKPMALTLAETDRLQARAQASPLKVMVGFNLRCHRLLHEARHMVQEGRLGDIHSLRTVFTNGLVSSTGVSDWRRHRSSGGGVLHDLAVHHFDLWRFLLNSEIENIFAVCGSARWDDEVATITGRMSNGVQISSVFSSGTVDSHEIDIFGQTGRLRFSCYRADSLEWLPTASTRTGILPRLAALTTQVSRLPHVIASARRGGDMLASYREQWSQFAAGLRSNASVGCTIEDGRRALQAVLAAMESADCGQPVAVAEGEYRAN
jgi:predicted dehydrogenase